MTREQHAPPVSSGDPSNNRHYAAIGGAEAVTRLVERFYAHMAARPEAAGILALHPADLAPVKNALVCYLSEWLGGPAHYSSTPGEPRLRRRHMRFTVGPAERDAWLLCMRAALADFGTEPGLRAELDAAFTAVAEYLRNDPEHRHEKHCHDPDHT